jgi:hypothetical protein
MSIMSGWTTERGDMRFTFLFIAFIAFTLATTTAGDVDITGEWNAGIPGLRGAGFQKGLFDLQANGSKLTGSIIINENEDYIFDGKINGDKISFKTKGRYGNMTFEFIYTGKVLAANEIEFKMKSSMINSPITTFIARRKQR